MSKGFCVDEWREEKEVLLRVNPKLLKAEREERATGKKLLQVLANCQKHDSPVISGNIYFL